MLAWRAASVGAFAFVLACGNGTPTPTGTICPTPDPMTLTWENFGQAFMAKYCTMCHASNLPRSMRNGAPIYHDFDSLVGVLNVVDHVDEKTGAGPDAVNSFMPTSRCPSVAGGALDRNCVQPTREERTNLSLWLACERERTHTFVDANPGPRDAGLDGP